MSLSVYNTLTRQREEVVPLEPGHIRMYTCGPTVYNFAHIGNFRAYVFEDLLRRYLKFAGYRVNQVMNLTDVEDKIILACSKENRTLKEVTQQYTHAFFTDLDTLNIERAESYPAATDHIPEMISIIRCLVEKGLAYKSEDGSVYFSIEKFPAYGRLSRLDKTGLRPGARVSQDEYEKENVGDFALWKAWDEKDGNVAWDSPWGRGRPGWHIECSAMSMKYLGESFDIHTGGIDNIFPHHEDEIAQSEAATGKKFVNYWMHCAHLIVDGKKMSKSLGNFYTLRDLLNRGCSGREIRYVLISTHYRQTLNFSFDSLDGAKSSLRRLDEFRERLSEIRGKGNGAAEAVPGWLSAARAGFTAALDDDLNISGALGALFDMVYAGNKAMDANSVGAGSAGAVEVFLDDIDRVLGFLKPATEAADPKLLSLLEARKTARESKNWAEADRIRAELQQQGWEVQDTPQGPKLKRL